MTPPESRAVAVRPIPAWAEQLVRVLDDGGRIPGTELRFGADALLGLVLPGAGDALSAGLSLLLFVLGLRMGVPRRVLWAMASNTVLDALLGAVPVAGDLFDLGFRANRRNLALLREASAAGVESRAGLGSLLLVGGVVALAMLLPLVVGGFLFAALWGAFR
jgi:Domain of unknown function (DUF4112)